MNKGDRFGPFAALPAVLLFWVVVALVIVLMVWV